jgi:chromosome segregation protein
VYLKHLTISGFKSFAKKGELEFTAPITAIVGPNGSGKSNVAESFRFVLGEQSLKSMRSKRGEDLIFGGSNAVSRANRASVEVVLDNTARVFPVDFDEVIVERTVHRDGQHEYKINNSKARLKDVQELLAAANIGTTGHHIISQGEADRILSSTAKERREMIEDALGLKVYQYKKTDAEKKLNKTRENIERVQQLRKEVLPHMQFLERQIKKMERATELRSELTKQYAEYLKREDVYIAFHHDRLERERLVPQATLAELESALEDAKATLQSHQRDAKSDELLNLEQTLKKIRDSRQQLIRESGQLDGQMSYLNRRITEAKQASTKEQDIPVPSSEVKKYIEATEKAVEKSLTSTDVPLLQRALSDVIHGGRKFLTTVLGNITVSTDVEERELRLLEKEQAKVLKQIEACEADEAKQTKAYETLRVSIEAEQSESRAAEREIFRISSEQRTAEHALSLIEGELRVLERDREEFKRELQEAVTLIGRDVSRYYELEILQDGKPVTDKNLVAEARAQQYERRRQLEKLKIRLEELGGVNQDIEKEYKEVKERDDFLVREIADLEASVEKLEAIIAELTNELNERFVVGIETISVEFKRFFTLMFGGGEASLLRVKPKVKKKAVEDEEVIAEEVVEEEEEMVEEGIELDVKLPNKRVRGLDMLSGGERALTSIALIFAMSQVNPPLFIILDETDAALDEANSRRYGDMIEALAEKSQLILITHNRETMSRAGILYGVTMGADGVSKLLSVKFAEAASVAKS